MPDYSSLKILLGTANAKPYEDPVVGSNGTMCITRINNFMQRVQDDLVVLSPQGKGNIIVGAGTEPEEMQVGPNNFCLTVDPTAPQGLLWEERVDLTTSQRVGGKKTFTSDLIALQDLNVGMGLTVGGNADVVGNLDAYNTTFKGTLEVMGGSMLRSTLTVMNNTNLQSNLSVLGSSNLNTTVVTSTLNVGGTTRLDSDLTVVGSATMQSNLSLDGDADIAGTVLITNDVRVGDSLLVVGNTTLTTLVASGAVSLGDSTLSSLKVMGNTTLNSLVLTAGLNAGGNITTTGGIIATDDIVTASGVRAGGQSVMGNVDATALRVSGTSSTNKLVVLDTASIDGPIWVGGTAEIRSTLTVAGNTALKQALIVSGATTLASTTAQTIDVLDTALVRGDITSGGSVTVTGDLNVGGDTFLEGSATVELDLTVGGKILSDVIETVSTSTSQLAATKATLGEVTTPLMKAVDIQYTGTVAGNTATADTMTMRVGNIITSHITNLQVTGSATIPGLSGINTGDEVEATPTISGTVRVSSNTPDPIVYTVGDSLDKFVQKSEVGISVASLVGGKVPASQIPALAITEPHVVTTIAEMNGLNAQVGDVAILSNPPSTYILQTEPNGWIKMNTPTETVPSVFGRTGPITAQIGDYTAPLIPIQPIVSINADDVQGALEILTGRLVEHKEDINNPHSVTAEQVGAVSLWEKGSGLGVATLDEQGKVPVEQLPEGVMLVSTTRVVVEFSSQDLISNILEVQHNLGDRYPSNISVYSNLGRLIIPDDIEVVDAGTLKLYLNSYTNMIGVWRVVVSI
jgi:cytoskeletal protein CcmA (bactofilin family)